MSTSQFGLELNHRWRVFPTEASSLFDLQVNAFQNIKASKLSSELSGNLMRVVENLGKLKETSWILLPPATRILEMAKLLLSLLSALIHDLI